MIKHIEHLLKWSHNRDWSPTTSNCDLPTSLHVADMWDALYYYYNQCENAHLLYLSKWLIFNQDIKKNDNNICFFLFFFQCPAISSIAWNKLTSVTVHSSALWSCLCSNGSRSLPTETRRTEEVQEQAERRPVLGWRQQPEPHPAQANSPPVGSAKPRKSRRIKTNVLFCNIERVCVSVRVGVLCIGLSVRKGTASVSPRTGHTKRAAPSLMTNNEGEVRQDWRRICCSQTTGACYPLSSAEPGHQRQGHYNDNYPVSFIESAKLCYKLHSALYLWCGVKFIRGGMFYIKRHNLKKQNVTLSPLSFPKKEETINFIQFLLLQLISFFFFVRINIYKTYI